MNKEQTMSMISELVGELKARAHLSGIWGETINEHLFNKAADTIEMLSEKAREPRQREWIPCDERLPEENKEVLISFEWGIDIGEYRDGEWHSEFINQYDEGEVLAWMPLPKPWEGTDDDL